MSPPLALGQSVHEVLENLSSLPTKERFRESLIEKYHRAWEKVSGKKGGFFHPETEKKYKERGEEMIRRVMNHPGPVADLAVKMQMDLPYFWLSEEDNIILCGKIDWLQYLPDTDSVNIIDFKTGKNTEDPDSLQLPIYHLLVHHCQKRKVTKASYWYLESSNLLEEKPLPDLATAHARILDIAKKIKLARQLEHFKCPQGADGCFSCRPFEQILRGEAECIGPDEFKYDVYVFDRSVLEIEEREGVLL